MPILRSAPGILKTTQTYQSDKTSKLQ